MSELSFNHVGEQFQLQVGGDPVRLTLPLQVDKNGVALKDEWGRTLPMTPSHAIIVIGSQPIRWRADGTEPTASMGILQDANSRMDWMNPQADYRGLIANVYFVRDSTATGDSILECAFFT